MLLLTKSGQYSYVFAENDITAPNKAQQVRQACRAIRCFPERPPRKIILRSNSADKAATTAHADNMNLNVGESDVDVSTTLKRMTLIMAMAIIATISKKPVDFSFLNTIAHAVVP